MVFYKTAQAFSDFDLQPEQQTKIITSLKDELKRPETSYTLRKDYKNLLSLASCTKKMTHCRHKSMANLRRIKKIHDHKTMQNFYQPVKS